MLQPPLSSLRCLWPFLSPRKEREGESEERARGVSRECSDVEVIFSGLQTQLNYKSLGFRTPVMGGSDVRKRECELAAQSTRLQHASLKAAISVQAQLCLSKH